MLIHRKVCAREHGPIPKGWSVLHLDGDVTNNTANNLIALPKSLYAKYTKELKVPGTTLTRDSVEAVVKAWKGLMRSKQRKISISIKIERKI